MITLCELGGAQSVVCNLSNELVGHGHDVVVVAGEGDGKMFETLDDRIQRERIPSLVRRLSPLNEIKTLVSLRRLYRAYSPDIVHLHSSKAGFLGRLAFPSKKIVYTVHGFDSIRIAYRKFLPLEKVLQNSCSAIVGVSEYDIANLLDEGICSNVSRIYNGVSRPVELSANPFKHLLGYEHRILCIARLAPPKNVRLFFELAELMPNCAFIWIGNTETPDEDYPENVYFMGSIPQAGAYARYADVFILPSNYEGLPMVIIEALACGTPVVASAVGGIPEILDGSNGYFAENDAEKMAEKIRLVLKMGNNMSVNAVNTYKRAFTVEKMTEEYEKIYNEILMK